MPSPLNAERPNSAYVTYGEKRDFRGQPRPHRITGVAQTRPQFLVTPANDLEVGMLTHVYEGRVCFRTGVSHAFAYCTNAWRWALELHVTLWSFL